MKAEKAKLEKEIKEKDNLLIEQKEAIKKA